LRLRWEVTDETVAAVASCKPVAKLDEETRTKLLAAFDGLTGGSWASRDEVVATVREMLSDVGVAKAAEKDVVAALSVRDSDAPPVLDKQGRPEPDPELRDQENVTLPARPVTFDADPSERLASDDYRRAVDDYVRAEVLPFVPDAWVDH